MKKFYVSLLLTILFYFSSESQGLQPAPADKAVIYIARPSGLGAAINFTYIDSATLIGRFNGEKYIRYECTPGHHIIWARSENRDFIEAEVDAGKIYIIEAVPQLGAIKAGVHLEPVGPSDQKALKRIMKLINKRKPQTFSDDKLEKISEDITDIIQRGLEKYQEAKNSGQKILQLTSDMSHEIPAAG